MSLDPSVNALGSPGAAMSLSEPQSDKLSLAGKVKSVKLHLTALQLEANALARQCGTDPLSTWGGHRVELR